MVGTKEISENLCKTKVDTHQAGKIRKLFPKTLDCPSPQIVYKEKQFNTTVTLPQSGQLTPQPRARHVIFQEVTKNPRVMPKKLKVSLAMVNVLVHKPTITKALNNNGVHVRIARRKPLLSKRNIATHLQNEKEPFE